LGPFLGVKFPLTVIQMLWVNLIMDTFAALALATEPPHNKVMDRPPRSAGAFIVTKKMAASIFAVAAIFLVVLIGMLLYLEHAAETNPELSIDADRGTKGGTIFFSVFVFLQFWNLFNARAMGTARSAFSGLGENRAFLMIAAAILVGQIVLVTFFGWVFRTVPLSLVEWLVILAATSPVLWIGEIWRAITRRERGAKSEGMG
jgi:Ca2+-transporting ATPase